MASYTTVQNVFVTVTFCYLVVLVLLWRDSIVEFLSVLHHREALLTGLLNNLKKQEVCVTNCQEMQT
jgi:hypothetical protein